MDRSLFCYRFKIMEQTTGSQDSRPPRWDIWDLIMITAATLVILTLGQGLVMLVVLMASGNLPTLDALADGSFGFGTILENLWAVVAIASLNFFVVVLVVPIVLAIRGKLSWELLGFKRFPLWWFAIMPVAFFVLYPIVSLVVTQLQMLLYNRLDTWQTDLFVADEFSWPLVLASVFVLGVLVPVGEEIIFRSMLYLSLIHI